MFTADIIFLYTCVFIFGAIIGSFLNVVIYRLPQGLSLSVPRSHCPSCGHALAPIDLVPILSYLFLRGRCRRCSTAISPRYPGVELLCAVVFTVTFHLYGFSLQTLVYLIFCAMLIAIAFIDMDCQRIPNQLTLAIAILAGLQWVGGATNWIPNALSLKGMLFGMALGGGILLIIILLGAVRGVSAMGIGDLKLMLASGLLLGPVHMFTALVTAFLLGGAGALVAIFVFKRDRKSYIPFGPYLVIGLLSSLWFGTWYLL